MANTTSDKLTYLEETKAAIKDAIVSKGVTIPDGTTFRQYAEKIGKITIRVADGVPIPDETGVVNSIRVNGLNDCTVFVFLAYSFITPEYEKILYYGTMEKDNGVYGGHAFGVSLQSDITAKLDGESLYIICSEGEFLADGSNFAVFAL